MVKAIDALKASRRQFLAAAPAAAIAGSVPAVAGMSDVSPELLALFEHRRALKAKEAQLDAVYDKCHALFKAICPAVPAELPLFKTDGRRWSWDDYKHPFGAFGDPDSDYVVPTGDYLRRHPRERSLEPVGVESSRILATSCR